MCPCASLCCKSQNSLYKQTRPVSEDFWLLRKFWKVTIRAAQPSRRSPREFASQTQRGSWRPLGGLFEGSAGLCKTLRTLHEIFPRACPGSDPMLVTHGSRCDLFDLQFFLANVCLFLFLLVCFWWPSVDKRRQCPSLFRLVLYFFVPFHDCFMAFPWPFCWAFSYAHLLAPESLLTERLTVPKSQIAIATIFPRRSQIARKLRRKRAIPTGNLQNQIAINSDGKLHL